MWSARAVVPPWCFKLDETIYLRGQCPSCQRQAWADQDGPGVAGVALRRLTNALKEWRQAERGAPYEVRPELGALAERLVSGA